jgi:hypothetical protein
MESSELSRILKSTRAWSLASMAGGALFLLLLTALHFLEPEYDPARVMISYYELGRYGPLMSIAFISLGASILFLMFATRHAEDGARTMVARVWFYIVSFALLCASVFYPYETGTISTLHTLAGVIVIFSIPIATTIYASRLKKTALWASRRSFLTWGQVSTWFAFSLYMGATIVLGIVAGTKKDIPIGWPNRIMMAIYCVWIMALSWNASRVGFTRKGD